MIYVYDIVVNFNNELIDFYDWLEDDYLEHIRKIPMIKVDDKIYKDFLENDITLEETELQRIKNKTEVFSERKIEKIEYAFILCSKMEAIALIFDDKGKISERSRLLTDEELEIIEISKKVSFYNLKYKRGKKIIKKTTCLREEQRVIDNIVNILKNLKKEKREDLLNYLHYEWFLREAKNNNSFEDMINDIEKEYTLKHSEFLNLINFTKNH